MAIVNLNTIKNWFKTGLKPTQAQFWDAWDSFRHKNEKVPVADIEGIDALLLAKSDKAVFDNHLVNINAHIDLFNNKEDKAKKGVAGGYAPLNEFRKIENEFLNIATDFGYKNVAHFGNSICKHPILADIWWGAWGMAATVRENDYVHRFLAMLQEVNPSATSDALNIAPWETDYATFDKSTLDPYLENKDLVVLRLGENVTYYADFQNQYKILVQYIQSHAPDADIILGGQFWANPTKETAMMNVALELGLPFVSLSHLDSATYKETIGGVVYGDDGLTHTITNAGVANHPNDLGMLKIAEGLFSAIDFKKETDKTTPQKTIIGNITLDNSFNGCIVKIKANATITVPSTLKPYFNCVFDSWTGFTGTFVAGSGVTISSSGLKLLSEKMGTLYKDGSAPFYRLKGETSV